jgi:glycosyltransferase involved in cell wall biosynthesis
VSLSVCIITRDEEQDLPRCLASVRALADQIVVVDSGSTDGTLEIAREAGAEIVHQEWLGFVGQRQVSMDHARGEWILCLDADEWLDEELAAAVAEVVAGGGRDGVAGYELNRRVRYLGAWIDHCGWSPEWRLRLVRAGGARAGGVEPHDHIQADGAVARLAGRLNHPPYRDLAEHLAKVNAYTDIMATRAREDGRRSSWSHLLLRPAGRFLKMYVLRAGFADGWRGLVVSAVGAFYVFLKYSKLREAEQTAPGGLAD